MDFVQVVFLSSHLCIVIVVHGAPTYNSRTLDVAGYLYQYGFSNDNINKQMQEEGERSLKLFQRYYGLTETGIIDRATYNLMTSSRCGVGDNPEILQASEEYADSNRTFLKPQAYKLTGPKWSKRELKWGISSYTGQLDKSIQRKTLGAALSRWGDVSGLTFTYSEAEPDIDIRFVSRTHGDGSPFDGPSSSTKGNVLAHAFPPGSTGLPGDAHFDNDERWTVDASNTVWERKSLEKVAAHEFGHSLGLQHSRVNGALMNAYYTSTDSSYKLARDDQQAIQFLYGKPYGWRPTLGGWVPTPPPSVPSCHQLFTAVVWGADKKAYGIYMDEVYSITSGADRKTRSLQEVFPGSPIEVDFAVSMNKRSRQGRETVVTYMFMGRNVWRFTSYTLDPGYPQPLRVDIFPEPPLAVTAAVEKGRESIFMIGRTQFWIWDESYSGSERLPGQEFQSYWSHSPSSFPLVTSWLDGDVYLISHDNHVRMKSRSARPGYPKRGVPDWIYESCPGSAPSLFASLSLTLFVLLMSVRLS